ncbi:MAG: glycosyltransferase family 2 protein [Flavobacteriales bacterium]|nr:glycosyltransferase family 2 protein [Flavobacteriales bacterium]
MSDMATAQPIRVRVVIPCRNEAGYISRCLESLIACDRGGAQLEVWVCDGMSEDGTRTEVQGFARMHPWIRLVDNPDRTTPQAMSIGLRPPGYDMGIILGAHAEVDHVFLRANLEALTAHPEAGCVGGVIENVFQDATSRRIGAAMGHPFGVGSAHFRTGRREGYVDTVAFGAYRREVFERVGYFDERLARNQDDEFNYRVTKAGFRIWLSSAIRSRYVVRGTYAKLWRQYRQYGYWKVYVNRLHRTVTTLRQVVPALFVAFLVAGPALCWLHPAVAMTWCLGLIAYAVATCGFALQAAHRWNDMPGVALAFVVLHLSYGIGYLQGIVDFILLRKEPKAQAAILTR